MPTTVADMRQATHRDEHRHRWSDVDFVLRDGRPFVRQTCDCGAERRFRAFERFWDPEDHRDGDHHPA